MLGSFYRIDTNTCNALNLWDREAMVYSALLYLCKAAPYKGSAAELAQFSRIKSKTTTLRMLSNLITKGLIVRNTEGISLVQCGADANHSGAASVQYGAFSKEKRTKKENINKRTEYNVCNSVREYTHTTASPIDNVIKDLFHMQPLIPTDKPAIPANTGYYRIITTEFGYMNPKSFVDNFYLHYNAHGWPTGGNKLDLMRYWMTQYTHRRGSKKPQLSENERLVLKTFLDNIEQRLIVRLFNVVKMFELTDTQIIFHVEKTNVENFVVWLNSMPLHSIFAAYNRTVAVKTV